MHFLLLRPRKQIPEPDTVRECEMPRRKPDWRAQQRAMVMGICFFRKGGHRPEEERNLQAQERGPALQVVLQGGRAGRELARVEQRAERKGDRTNTGSG